MLCRLIWPDLSGHEVFGWQEQGARGASARKVNSIGNIDLFDILVTLFALVISITVHEFAHAYSAVRAGDDTPRLQGRISLNPVDHFDPIGFTMMCLMVITGFGIGWGKPVQVNSYNFRHPRWDDLKVSAWGPGSNLIMAALAAAVVHVAGRQVSPGLLYLLVTLVGVNVTLAVFNLIPLPPLDGSHILSALLPIDKARAYARFAGQYGMAVLLLLLLTGGLRYIIGPPSQLLLSLLLPT